MTKYEKIQKRLKENWLGITFLLAISFLISLPQIRDGIVLVLGLFEKENKSQATLSQNPPYLEHRTGENFYFEELLISRDVDLIKIDGHTYDLMIPAQYGWLNVRYPAYKDYDRMVALGGISLDGVPVNDEKTGKLRCSENILYFDMHLITIAKGIKKRVFFDISKWKHHICGKGPGDEFSESESILNAAIDKHYRKAKERGKGSS